MRKSNLVHIGRGAISSTFFLISLLFPTLKGAIELGEQESGLIFFSDVGIRSVTEVKGHKVFHRHCTKLENFKI